ncbi:MAG TPA: hypothetical protein DCS82_05160 [Rhodospirillaceae bacterium]|nr:hypothetical protein [Rhodospirillaceae bacterium]HAT35085.1 hypothetical protein [Rhodospirillaceae bacterium]
MAGLCLAAGNIGSEDAVARMLGRLAQPGQSKEQVTATPELSVGHVWHHSLAHFGAPISFDDGLVCAIGGEVFDDHGLYEESASLIADLYRSDHLHRIAWLNGSFCIAVLDPNRNRVALVTDRLASKSFFVWHDEKALIASTRLDAMVAEDRVPKRISRQGIAELLVYQRTVADHTQYSDVASLPAAQIWIWENGHMKKQTARKLTWSAPDFSKSEAAEGLASALTRATARRLSDPVRHGLLMSGGLDSRAVLAATRHTGKRISCATVCAWDNTEVGLARTGSEISGMPFKLHHSDAADLAQAIAPSTAASDGLFAAPINLYSSLPAIAADHDVLLSGHGLDYTLRGYYLPCRTLEIAGSKTRLPSLRKIDDGTPESISGSLRAGISPETAKKILAPKFAAELDTRRVDAMAAALENCDIEDDYNNWDAFILHSLGRHYAYSDFVAIEETIHHRPIAFDPVVFDLYLSMPPAWRAEGKVAHEAMMQLDPELMRLADANTGFSARHGFSKQIVLQLMRAVLRRLGLLKRPHLPDPAFTHGSWLNTAVLFRQDPTWRSLAEGLAEDPALNATGLFQSGGLRQIVDEHLESKTNHNKLLMQLLTIASWFAAHPFDEVAA